MRFCFLSSPMPILPTNNSTPQRDIPCDRRWYRGQPLCISRGCCPRYRKWSYRYSGSWWKNHTDVVEANHAPKLLSGYTLNLRSEDIVDIYRQGISVDDDNNPEPDNVPRQVETTAGTGNWRREGIICPLESGNLQNYFAYFRHYSHDAVLRMSLLQFFLLCSQRTILRNSSFLRPTRV